jgi:hypothetical protein
MALLSSISAFADAPRSPETGAILLTIFLKHDQSKNLGEIQAELKKAGYEDSFPPRASRWFPGM